MLVAGACLAAALLAAAPVLSEEAAAPKPVGPRMAPGAEEPLRAVAMLRAGESRVEYVKGADGVYTASYTGSSSSGDETIEELLVPIAIFADEDGSGTVSSSEGIRFRRTLEFGRLAAHVAEAEGTTSPRKIAACLGMEPEELRRQANAYRDLRERLGSPALDLLPELPF